MGARHQLDYCELFGHLFDWTNGRHQSGRPLEFKIISHGRTRLYTKCTQHAFKRHESQMWGRTPSGHRARCSHYWLMVVVVALIDQTNNVVAPATKHFLRCVSHIEETILVLVFLVDFGDGLRRAGHRLVVDDEIKSSARRNTQPVLNYDCEIQHCQLLWDQKFCLIHNWQINFALVSLDNNGNFGWKLFPNVFYLQFSCLK